MNPLSRPLAEICARYGVIALYVLGSRAPEVVARVTGGAAEPEFPDSDIDFAVLMPRDQSLDMWDQIRLTGELEDLFAMSRADLADLQRANAFFALDAIRGERIFCRDAFAADEFELYVMRRAGDLEPFERRRREVLLAPGPSPSS
jgi:predicted nucleotidyltransferase